MDANLKRDIILDNYQNPFNKEKVEDKSYISVNSNNESCIDDINLYIKIDNDKVSDAKFDGEACAISTSSTSIMLKMIMDKEIDDIKELKNNFNKMINEEKYNEKLLGEAIVFNEIYKQNNRKNCALLPWIGLNKVLKQYEEKNDI